MCKLGGTEKPHGKALVLIIHIFATFFKVPLEAHEAQEGETNGRMNNPSKKKYAKRVVFLSIGGPKDDLFGVKCFGPLFKNVLPTAARNTFLQNLVKNCKHIEKVPSQASNGKYDAYMCGLCGAHGGS